MKRVRQIEEVLDRIVAMHDRMLPKLSKESPRISAGMRGAREAIAYFSSHAAVRYLCVGLGSEWLDMQVETANALHELRGEMKGEDRRFVVSALASFLEGRSPIVQGGEAAVVQQVAIGKVSQLLAELVGIDARGLAGKDLIEKSRQWLKAQQTQSKLN